MTNFIITLLLSFGLSATSINSEFLPTTDPPTDQNENGDTDGEDGGIVIIDILEG